MEISGSGGILLLVLAVLWLGFMAPSAKRTQTESRRKRKVVSKTYTPVQEPSPVRVQIRNQQNPWFQADLEAIAKQSEAKEEQETKVQVNRLPDPLSARLGRIENVQWAEVKDLNRVREVKENLTAESLDEILQRRRSNG